MSTAQPKSDKLAWYKEILRFFSLQWADAAWQSTVAHSYILNAFFQPLNFVRAKMPFAKVGNLLQLASFVLMVLLFGVIALPQFANDKEGLALIALAATALFVLGELLGGAEGRDPNATDGIVIGYLALNIIAAFASHYFEPSLKGLAKVAVYLIAYFLLTVQLAGHPRRKLILVSVLVLTGALVSLYGLYQYKIGVAPLATWEDPNVETKAVRIYSTLNNPNLLAGYLVPLVPLAMGLTVAALAHRRWFFALIALGSTAIASLAILLTGSRGGYLGLFGGLVFFALIAAGYLWNKKPRVRPLLIVLLIALPLALFGVIHLMPSFEHRFTSIFAGREHSSNSFRLNVWMSSLAMLKDNWWLGVGIGNQAFVLAYGLYMRSGFDALGTYCVPLEVAVETGFLGLLVFIWMVVAGLCRGHLNFWDSQSDWHRWLSAGAAAAMMAIMTHGLVDTVFYRPQVQFIFWLILAILLTSLSPAAMASSKIAKRLPGDP